MPIYEPYILPIFAVWVLGNLLLIGRGSFPILLRLMSVLICLLFGFLLEDEIYLSYWDWRDHTVQMLRIFYRTLGGFFFAVLFVAWPAQLILIFYKADYKGSARILKVMTILSLIIICGTISSILLISLRKIRPNTQGMNLSYINVGKKGAFIGFHS